jgi:hypothetical protein
MRVQSGEGLAFQNTENLAFAQNQQLFTVNLYGAAGVLTEDDFVADFNVEGANVAAVGCLARSSGQDFTL